MRGRAMRTTVSIPDDLAEEVQEMARGRSMSDFTREALRERVDRLKREQLARELDEAYRSEAEDPSLDPDWSAIETGSRANG